MCPLLLCDLTSSALLLLRPPSLFVLPACFQLDSVDDDEDASANGGGAVRPTPLGRVASLYYLQHTTAALIAERFRGRQLTHTEVRTHTCLLRPVPRAAAWCVNGPCAATGKLCGCGWPCPI